MVTERTSPAIDETNFFNSTLEEKEAFCTEMQAYYDLIRADIIDKSERAIRNICLRHPNEVSLREKEIEKGQKEWVELVQRTSIAGLFIRLSALGFSAHEAVVLANKLIEKLVRQIVGDIYTHLTSNKDIGMIIFSPADIILDLSMLCKIDEERT